MPVNVFLGVSVGTTRLTMSSTQNSVVTQFASKFGFMVAPILGKEWWVSDNWGLGLAAQYTFSVVPDQGPEGITWYGHSIGGLVTTTYN